MSQTRVNLASARRELAERKDEVALIMAELKAAQDLMATGGSGSKLFKVTVQETFGAITVDRAAVRSEKAPAQEKVVAEGIPCAFTLESGVESFDLVLMAEQEASTAAGSKDAAAPAPIPTPEAPADSPAIDQEDAAAAAAAAAAAPAETAAKTEEAVVTATGMAESVDAATPAASASGVVPEEAATAAAEPAVPEADAAGETVAASPEAKEEAAAAVPAAADEAETPAAAADDAAAEAPKEGDEGVAETAGAGAGTTSGVDETPAVAGAGSESENAVDGKTSAGAEGGVQVEVQEAVAGGDGAALENGGVIAPTTGAAEPPVAAVAGAVASAAAAAGCSTVTIEVVVPSSELDFKAAAGQWRYLEAGATPVHGDDAVEVTKGVRFSTSLEAKDRTADEGRIVELTVKYDEAERRVRSAEAMIKKLQPASATSTGSSSRKKSAAAGGGSRKSAMKKGKGGTRAIKSDAGKGKGPLGTLSAAVGGACTRAKQAGSLAWGARNLVFFVSAVAVIHLHGDYLAV